MQAESVDISPAACRFCARVVSQLVSNADHRCTLTVLLNYLRQGSHVHVSDTRADAVSGGGPGGAGRGGSVSGNAPTRRAQDERVGQHGAVAVCIQFYSAADLAHVLCSTGGDIFWQRDVVSMVSCCRAARHRVCGHVAMFFGIVNCHLSRTTISSKGSIMGLFEVENVYKMNSWINFIMVVTRVLYFYATILSEEIPTKKISW